MSCLEENYPAFPATGANMNRISYTYTAVVGALFATPLFAGSPAADEKAVWSLEDNYWRYVQTNDLEHYRTLWHAGFLGWPLTNPEPVHKEHITDWIGAHTSLGEALKSYDLERLTSQVTGDYVTVAYRIHTNWVGNDGVDKPTTTRIVHSWLRSAGGKWQIISGMAAPANAHGP
jgi:ketosteroid isomerase-like protein